jgi:hypothetical protein
MCCQKLQYVELFSGKSRRFFCRWEDQLGRGSPVGRTVTGEIGKHRLRRIEGVKVAFNLETAAQRDLTCMESVQDRGGTKGVRAAKGSLAGISRPHRRG